MRFSEAWLRALVNPKLSTEALSHLLTMSGLEVESCEPVAPPFSKVVVGQVVAAEKHPNADRLKVCQVDAGTGERLNIVCGAPNVVVGMKAPVALVGAQLPNAGGAPLEIKRAEMRGVTSGGMLCSARELGLSEDHSGLLVVDDKVAVGTNIREALLLDDHVFEIKLTPNRADCLSVLGVAREVSALTGAQVCPVDVNPVAAKIDARFPVRITDANGCGRFTGRVIKNVNAAAPTPEWMKQRLERAGQRSISALVDVTNYVMLELGRPLHVYDLDKLQQGIDVRFGRAGEQLLLLNGQTVTLDQEVLAITDARGPIGLAGIMGGETTKADEATRNVFLESAFFYPDAIAGRARKFNFTSDASHRFERGVDFNNNVDGIERATQLILQICGGDPGPTDDVVAQLPQRVPVRMRAARARKVLGMPVSSSEMASIFTRLGLPHTKEGDGESEAFIVTPPSYRFDIAIEEDLIEEVARVYGFDRIPTSPPTAPAAMLSPPEAVRSLHDVRVQAATLGYFEVINFSFVDAQWEKDLAGNDNPIQVLNPIASQMSVMRSTLLGGLLANIQYNLAHKRARVRVFEVGRAYLRDPLAKDGPLSVNGLAQPMRIAGAAFGTASQEQWGERPARAVDFFDVKGDVEALAAPLTLHFEAAPHPAFHPGRSARVSVGGTAIGWLGELHPQWQRRFEIPGPVVMFELDAAPLQTQGVPAYKEVSKFPLVRRDISVEVAETVRVGDMIAALKAVLPEIVSDVDVFDLYRGETLGKGRKSLAFRVLLQDTRKTLTDAEVDKVIALAKSALQDRFKATLRQ